MIKTKEIPSVELYMIGSTLLDTITKYYEDPANNAKFSKWQQEREKKRTRRETVCG